MSFYFSAPPPVQSLKPGLARAKLAPALLAQAGCKACPMNGLERTLISPKMVPTGSTTPEIYIIGEAPGRSEDEKGKQFVGPSGKLLRAALPEGLRYRWNNSLRCRPPGNRNPTEVELACCMPKQIADITATKPKVVLALGNIPLQALLKVTGITKWRGRAMALHLPGHSCWVVPSFHPSYLLRTRKRDSEPSDYEQSFAFDLDLLLDLLKGPPPTRDLYDSDDQTIELLLKPKTIVARLAAIPAKAFTATDIETRHYRPYTAGSDILTAAIHYENQTFAFPIGHPQAKLKPADREAILDAYLSYLQRCVVYVHNAAFEGEWFVHLFGYENAYSYTLEDTMAQAFVLDERKGALSLDDLSLMHFGLQMKQLANLNKNRLDLEPLDDVLRYNGRDSRFTHALALRQRELLRQQKLLTVYRMQRSRAMAATLAQYRGVTPNAAALSEFDKQLAADSERQKVAIAELPIVKTFAAKHGHPFNPGSTKDLLTLLKANNLVASNETSTDEAVLEAIDHPLCRLLLDQRLTEKMHGTYIKPLLPKGKQIHADGMIHTKFNHLLTSTGRFSCIAKGTEVEVVRDLSKRPTVPIESVVVGDLVYCYDDQLLPTLRRVLSVMRTGIRQVVRVEWRGSGHRHQGYLDCTPQHPIRLVTGEWKSARDLVAGDRVMALHRKTGLKGHSRLYFTGGHQELDHTFVYHHAKRPYLRQRATHIHHIDHNRLNNLPENLERLPAVKHLQHHVAHRREIEPDWWLKAAVVRKANIQAGVTSPPGKGEEANNWVNMSRFALLRQLAKTKGRWTMHDRLGTQFNKWTLRQRCDWFGIDPTAVKARYTKAGIYVSRGLAKRMLNRWGITRAQKKLNLEYYKWKNLLAVYGLDFEDRRRKVNNHEIVSVRLLPCKVPVYDLMIEGAHNFIAAELNVHNSQDPNLQNFPKREGGSKYRTVIRARRKHRLVAIDYGQIEYRVFGMAAVDQAIINSLDEGTDVHMYWTERLLERYPRLIGGRKYLNDKAKIKEFRSGVKNKWTFPAFYGSGLPSISAALTLTENELSDLFAEFWQMFRGVRRWQRRTDEFYVKHNYVECLTGRRRRGPMSYNARINSPIQGTASDIVVDGMERLSRHAVEAKQLWMHPVLNVHDDLTFDVPDLPEAEFEDVLWFFCEQMLSCEFPFINVPLTVEVSIGDTWGTVHEVATLSTTDFNIVPPALRDQHARD